MKTLILWLSIVASVVSVGAHAGVITLSGFDGSETTVDFNVVSPGVYTGAYTGAGVSFESESGTYIFQNTGWLLGTTGYAFNTYGPYPDAKNGIIMNFGGAVTRMGMNFGNGAGSQLSALISAYDDKGNLVESLSLKDFGNLFVGFDFSSPVNKIVIQRTDGSDLFTFLDDVRFVRSVSVPESSSLALMLIGMVGIVGLRVRKNS